MKRNAARKEWDLTMQENGQAIIAKPKAHKRVSGI